MFRYANVRFVIAVWIFVSFCFVSQESEAKWFFKKSRNEKEAQRALAAKLEEAELYYQNGQYKKALKRFKKIEKNKQSSPNQKARAIIRKGNCFEKMEKPWPAFLEYQKGIDEYSGNISFLQILQTEYEIANEFLKRKKEKFLFFSVSLYGKAIQIYDHVADSGPYAPFAAESIYKSGLLSLMTKDFETAAEKFKHLIFKHPKNALTVDARIELARSLLKSAAIADSDGSYSAQSKRVLTNVVKQFPNHQRIAEARELLEIMHAIEAKRLLYLAEFYLRKTHRRKNASKRYLTQLIHDYGNTRSASRAKELLATISNSE